MGFNSINCLEIKVKNNLAKIKNNLRIHELKNITTLARF